MQLENPVFFGLQDQQTPEPLQAVMQLGPVVVSPVTNTLGCQQKGGCPGARSQQCICVSAKCSHQFRAGHCLVLCGYAAGFSLALLADSRV